MSNNSTDSCDPLQCDLEKLLFRARIQTLGGQGKSTGLIMPPIPDIPGRFWPDAEFLLALKSMNPMPTEVVAETATHQYLLRGWKLSGGTADDPEERFEFLHGIEIDHP